MLATYPTDTEGLASSPTAKIQYLTECNRQTATWNTISLGNHIHNDWAHKLISLISQPIFSAGVVGSG